MLDLTQLVVHINTLAQTTGSPLPPEWSAHLAWSMQPVESSELPAQVPLVALYQGREVFSPRQGSPCFQTAMPSVIVALIVCSRADLNVRVPQLRSAIYGWKAPGDRVHEPIYLSDQAAFPCEPLDVRGDHVWWQDHWLTDYAQTSS